MCLYSGGGGGGGSWMSVFWGPINWGSYIWGGAYIWGFTGHQLLHKNEENLSKVVSRFTEDSLNSINITKDMVLYHIKHLMPGKSPGPDGWHPFFLRELAEELRLPLSKSVVSVQRIEACITAIYKKNELNDYRAVSL